MAKWVRAYKDASGDIATAFPGNGHLSPHEAELAALRKQVKKLTNERDILKKAMAGSTGDCNTIQYSANYWGMMNAATELFRLLNTGGGRCLAQMEAW